MEDLRAENDTRVDMIDVQKCIQEVKACADDEDKVQETRVAWDDVHGKELDIEKVKAARSEEVKYIEGRGIYKVVDKQAGMKVISTESRASEVDS